jgi:tetratricopeptide (TPR) repeat protein
VLRYGRALVNYGRLESGIDNLQRVLRVGPGFTPTPEFNGNLLDARASAMLEIGHYAEVESLLALAAEAHRKAGELHTIYENPNIVLHARLLLALGRAAEASSVFLTYRAGDVKAADITRPRIEPSVIRAVLALEQGDADSASRLANQALTVVANSPSRRYLTSWEMQASLLAGKAALDSGHADRALPLLTRALELAGDLFDREASPRYADAQITLAECLLELGRPGEAKTLYTKASAIHASHTELADFYRKPLLHLKDRLAPGEGAGSRRVYLRCDRSPPAPGVIRIAQ